MLRALTFVLPSLDRTPLTNRLHREVVGVGLEPRRRDGAVHRAEVITLLSRLAVGFAEAVGEADVVDPGFLVALDLGAGRQTEDVLLSSGGGPRKPLDVRSEEFARVQPGMDRGRKEEPSGERDVERPEVQVRAPGVGRSRGEERLRAGRARAPAHASAG